MSSYFDQWDRFIQWRKDQSLKARTGVEPVSTALQAATSPLGHRAKLSDQDYIRWLEDADLTIGKELRLEIASRLRELTQ